MQYKSTGISLSANDCIFVHVITKLTVWNWALLERPTVVRPLDRFAAFYGTRRFITAFTRALWYLP
jgi:hypothetical protein